MGFVVSFPDMFYKFTSEKYRLPLSEIQLPAKVIRFIEEKHIISVEKCLSTSPVFFSIYVKNMHITPDICM